MKRVAIVLGFVLLTLVFAYLLLDAWGGSILRDEAGVFQARLKDLRAAQAARRLPPRAVGVPRDEDATPAISALAEGTDTWPSVVTPGSTLDARAFLAGAVQGSPLPPEAAAFLAARESDLRRLDEALACTRADWKIDYERGFEAKLPRLVGIRMLGQMLVLDGRRLEAEGDAQGAARRYVDAIRLGCILSDCTLIHAMVGAAVVKSADDRLAALIDGEKGSAVGAEVAATLAALEPLLPSASAAMEAEATILGHLAGVADRKSLREVLALGGQTPGAVEAMYTLGPGKALFAHGLRELREIYAEVIAALRTPDAALRKSALERAEQRAMASWNPLVKIAFPNVTSAADGLDAMRGRVARVREKAAAAAAR